jgi:magnesium transporter
MDDLNPTAADVPVGVPARDPEEAQRALARVQALLERQRRVESLVHREQVGREGVTPEEKKALVESLVHRQHLTELKSIIDRLHPADVAYILEALPRDDRMVVWDSVKSEADGAVLLEVGEGVRETLVDAMDRVELIAAISKLEADEIAAIADSLPVDVVEQVKQSLSIEERAQLRAAMSYPEDSVGARMDFEMVTIRDDVTLEVVLRYLRRFDALPDHTDQVFVVDRDDVLKGALPLDRLLINEPETEVASVMKTDLLTLAPFDDAGEAAQAFERYDLVSAPVVDANGRLIGRLTVDEVVDVIREESEEQALAQAGLREEEDLFATVWNSAQNRWLWLGVNMCTAFFASRVIDAFEGTIAKVVALAALMPIVAGIAGNSGNQTLTLLVRSIALGQVTAGNQRRLVTKEIAIALFNGAVWGSLASLLTLLLYRDSEHGMTLATLMFLAMILNMLVAAAVGLAVPLALRALNRDPAMGGSVLLTFTTDSGGFFIFLGLASLFFHFT